MTVETSKPAPGPLRAVQALINTADLGAGEDDLATTAGVVAFLRSQDAAVTTVTDDDRARLVSAREALRDLADPAAPRSLHEEAAARLSSLAGCATLRVEVTCDGAIVVPGCAGVDGFLTRVLLAVAEASRDGTWARLKTCRDATCRWAFYDASRNGRGAWCTMQVCGSRAKARAYRERRSVSA